jgi:hypothetical protein
MQTLRALAAQLAAASSLPQKSWHLRADNSPEEI